MKLRIADSCSLPVEIAGRRTAIFGISGSGKSNSATVLIEQLLHAGEQVVLVDPKGEGWGLLSLANGKASNLPVIIFGEPNGHIETLSEHHGQQLADFVVESGRSVVLSLLGFESDQSERRFVATFLRQLYRRKSRQGRPSRTLVVLDEAHLFIPEQVRGDGAELAGAVQRIVRQGRSFGIGTLLIDQRPQDVSKRAITQCDTLVCHQLTHKTDRDALSDWVRGYDVDGHGETFLKSLASLQPGEAWLWSPGWLRLFERVKVDRRKTFDSGAAPDGSEAARTVSRAEVDLDALRGQLAEIVDKAKADDPKELRKQIADLKRQLAARPTEQLTVEVEKIVERHVLKNGQLDKALAFVDRLDKIATPIREGIARVSPVSTPFPQTVPPRPFVPRPAPAPRPAVAKPTTTRNHADGDPTLGKCERSILQVLAQHPDGCTAGKLALLAGYRWSGGFRNALATLRTAGLILGSNAGTMTATVRGIAAADATPLPTGAALADYWLNHQSFGKCERDALRALIDNPSGLTAESLCELTGYQWSGGFRNALSSLRTAGVIVGRNGEVMRASSELFD